MTAAEGEIPQAEAAQQDVTEKRVAKDGAEMQTEDKSMPTRIPMEGGTKINMYFGDTLITGVLNDSETAQALIEKLPVTQHVNIPMISAESQRNCLITRKRYTTAG